MLQAYVLVAGLFVALVWTWLLSRALGGDSPAGPPPCGARLLVVVPLPSERVDEAEAAVRALLEAWRAVPPCDWPLPAGWVPAVKQPTAAHGAGLVFAWLGRDSHAASLRGLVAAELGLARHCFTHVDVLGREELQRHAAVGRSAGAEWGPMALWQNATLDTVGATNALFVSSVGLSSARATPMLWMPPLARPLRPRWLSELGCEAAALPDAWIVGSPLLMDCEREGGWTPAPPCCADGSAERAEWYLGPAGVYASHSPAFREYVAEWATSTLAHERFDAALSGRLWLGYGEARQRVMTRRFVASEAVADAGAEQMSASAAHRAFPSAMLLLTLNLSRPVVGSSRGAASADDSEEGLELDLALPLLDSLVSARSSRAAVGAALETATDVQRTSAGGGAASLQAFGEAPAGVSAAVAGEGDEAEDASEGARAEAGVSAQAPPAGASIESVEALEDALTALALSRAGGASALLVGFGAADAPDFALNWASALQRLGLRNWLLVALDTTQHASMLASDLVGPAASALAPPSRQGVGARTPRATSLFTRVGSVEDLLQAATRVRAIALLLSRTHLEVLTCDVDVIPLSDPWPSIKQHRAGGFDEPKVGAADAAAVSHRFVADGANARGNATSGPFAQKPYDLLFLSEWPDALSGCGSGGALSAGVGWPCASLGVVFAGRSRETLALLSNFQRDLQQAGERAGETLAASSSPRDVLQAADAAAAGAVAAGPSALSILAEALGLPSPLPSPSIGLPSPSMDSLTDPSTDPLSSDGPAAGAATGVEGTAPARRVAATRAAVGPAVGPAAVGSAAAVRWRLLEPSCFPNGFIAFRRPLSTQWRERRSDNDAPAAVVMLRASWPYLRAGQVDDAAELRYRLREMRLWLPTPAERETQPRGRFLAYGVTGAVDGPLHRQRGALQSALMLCRVLRRTLILPPFWTSAHGGRRADLASLYDYRAFDAVFGHHREASFAALLPPPRTFHIAIADGMGGAGGAASPPPNMTAGFVAGSKGAPGDVLQAWLQPWADAEYLWFDRMYHRVSKLGKGLDQPAFDASFRAALQPAPEYVDTIARVRGTLAAAGGYNCLHVSDADLNKNGERIFARAAKLLPSAERTLFASDTALGAGARAAMGRHFSTPLYIADLLPPASRVLFDDVEGRITLGLELVDTHVCASAALFAGNLLTPFSQAVCYERDGIRGLQISRGDAGVLRPCTDLYRRGSKHQAAEAPRRRGAPKTR